MKIGIFHPALYMNGGAEVVALKVTNALARDGYDVTLFANKNIDQKETTKILGEPVDPSVKMVIKSSSIVPRTLFDVYRSVFCSASFKSKCDILVDTYSNFFYPWSDVCYTHFPFMNRLVYSSNFPYLKNLHLMELGSLPYALLEKKISNLEEKLIIANSYFTADAINEFFDTNVHVLYPPISSKFFEKNLNVDEKQRENLVVTVSRIGFGKGLELIPRIAKFTNNTFKFVIMGVLHDPKLLQLIMDDIKKFNLSDRVKVLTNVPQKQMLDILKTSKIYLHTTVNEHFGISIAEAMAMGCVPIVHDSGGAKEFVPAEYRYTDIYECATKIERFADDWNPSKSVMVRESAKKFKDENFSKGLLKMFNKFLEQKRC